MFKSDEIPHLGFKIHVTEISTNPFDVVPLVSSIVTKQFFFFFVFKIMGFFMIVLSHIKISQLRSGWSQDIFYPNVILELRF